MDDPSQDRHPVAPGVKKSLTKADKIRLFSEFAYIRANGREFPGKRILVVAAPTPDGKLRGGVICGKKFSKLAVIRNRARRLLWESFRLLKPHLGCCHLILIPRRRLLNCRRPEVTKEMAELLARAGLLPAEIAASPPES